MSLKRSSIFDIHDAAHFMKNFLHIFSIIILYIQIYSFYVDLSSYFIDNCLALWYVSSINCIFFFTYFIPNNRKTKVYTTLAISNIKNNIKKEGIYIWMTYLIESIS